MANYLKSTAASYLPTNMNINLPSNLRSKGIQLPNPTPYYERTQRLQAKYPRMLLGLAVVIFLFFWKDIIRDSVGYVADRRAHARVEGGNTAVGVMGEGNPVLNSTLGFQKLFMLSIPDRSDRRVPLLAGANATNLTVTVIDAIRDRQVPKEYLPEWWGSSGWTPKEGELGCLMSHLRTWKKMIHENITSALIMESDVDWDMRIKQSMVGVAEGVRHIADWPFDPLPTPTPSPTGKAKKAVETVAPQPRPYGDKWDLVWLGHCGSSANGDGRIYAFNDSAAPDEDHAWAYGDRPADGHRPEGTRIVYQLHKTVCTTSYAISLQGARKFANIFKEANSPIDLKIWDACAQKPELACLAVWPQVISMTESRTNIKHTEGGLSFGHEITEEKLVAGKSIQVSSRINAHMGLADKGPEGWKWEWGSATNSTWPPSEEEQEREREKKVKEEEEKKKEGEENKSE